MNCLLKFFDFFLNINFVILLLVFVVLMDFRGVEASPTIVKCSDGKLPLLDENYTLFDCRRGCPATFYCEPSSSLCCPNTTALITAETITVEATLLRGKKEVDFQLESSAELEKSISCERFPYKTSCDSPMDNGINSTVQPVAKWYFDVATLSCEMYPFGMCVENDPMEKLALRTKSECEERCDVAKVKEVLESLKSEESDNGPHVVHFNRFPISLVPQIAIDDVVQESKHLQPRGRPFAIEPPTDLFHVIHVKSDAIPRGNIVDEPLLTTTDSEESTDPSVPTVTSDILNVFEEPLDDDGDILEGSGGILTGSEKFSKELENDGRITVTVTQEEEEIDENEKFQKKREKSPKSIEASFERFYQSNKESVVCSQSAYRLICPRGTPSQFVYRWEKVDGMCLSFPYGYCLGESNIPHPRTRAECEQFCD